MIVIAGLKGLQIFVGECLLVLHNIVSYLTHGGMKKQYPGDKKSLISKLIGKVA